MRFLSALGLVGLLGTLVSGCSIGGTCDGGICGCSVDVTLEFSASVIAEPTQMPAQGIQVFCDDETTPITTTDAMGNAAFSIETTEAGGCGYGRCNILHFRDPSGALAEKDGNVDALDDTKIELKAKAK